MLTGKVLFQHSFLFSCEVHRSRGHIIVSIQAYDVTSSIGLVCWSSHSHILFPRSAASPFPFIELYSTWWTRCGQLWNNFVSSHRFPSTTSVCICWYQPSLGSWLSHQSPSPPWHKYLMSVCLFPSPLHTQNEPQTSACVFRSFTQSLKHTAIQVKTKSSPPAPRCGQEARNASRCPRQPINKWSSSSFPLIHTSVSLSSPSSSSSSFASSTSSSSSS